MQSPNEQPIGFPVPDWTARPYPPHTPMHGHWIRLEPLSSEAHAADLYGAMGEDRTGALWTYLFDKPPRSFEEYAARLTRQQRSEDPQFFSIVEVVTGRAVGVASYLRIDPPNGVIEVGHIQFSPRLQRTSGATEAMYLMMRRAFEELGYRRYEWKCDNLNKGSHAAARRLGFTYEGLFRQAIVYKGRNRDTAWYSITDKEWPGIQARLERWLEPTNFDSEGRQRTSLEACRKQRNSGRSPAA